MRLSTPVRWMLGVVSLLPLCILLYIWLSTPFLMAMGADQEAWLKLEDVLRLVNMVVLITAVTLSVSYVARSTDKRLSSKKVFWTAALVLGHIIALPVFWFLYVSPWAAEARRSS